MGTLLIGVNDAGDMDVEARLGMAGWGEALGRDGVFGAAMLLKLALVAPSPLWMLLLLLCGPTPPVGPSSSGVRVRGVSDPSWAALRSSSDGKMFPLLVIFPLCVLHSWPPPPSTQSPAGGRPAAGLFFPSYL